MNLDGLNPTDDDVPASLLREEAGILLFEA